MNSQRVLTGNLDFLSLAEVLQLLNANGASGILVLRSPYASEPGVIYFNEGNAVNATCLSKKGIDAAFALFGWTDGEFEFTKTDVKTERVITHGMMELVLDGLRMLDDDQVEKLGLTIVEEIDAPSPARDEYAVLPVIKRPVSNYGYVVDEEEVQANEFIVQEGMHGNWICIILEGFADVVRESPKGRVRLIRLGPGALVGNISSMLSQKSVRTASLVSATHTILGVLDLARIHTEFAVMSYEMRHFAMSLDRRLRRVTDQALSAYLKEVVVQDFIKDRKPILPKSPEGQGLFEITKGTVSIVKKIENRTIPLAILEKGDCIGQTPFVNLGHEPGKAVALGSEDCTLKPIDLASLHREYRDVSSMIKGILDHIISCLAVTTSLVADPSKILPHKDC